MKKLILTILLFCLIPFYANAGNLADLTIRIMPDISYYCGLNALGCCKYVNDTIYIKSGYNEDMFEFVFWHEMGHYLMEDITYEEYQKVFGVGTMDELAEIAANRFHSFVILGKFRNLFMSKTEINFFTRIIQNATKTTD